MWIQHKKLAVPTLQGKKHMAPRNMDAISAIENVISHRGSKQNICWLNYTNLLF